MFLFTEEIIQTVAITKRKFQFLFSLQLIELELNETIGVQNTTPMTNYF